MCAAKLILMSRRTVCFMATAETDTSLRHRQPLYSPPDVVDVKAYISSYLLSVSVPGSSILLYPVVAECCPLDIIIIIIFIIIHTTTST